MPRRGAVLPSLGRQQDQHGQNVRVAGMSSSRVVRVRPADGRWSDARRRCCATASREIQERARGDARTFPPEVEAAAAAAAAAPAAARPRPHRPADGDDRPARRRWTSTRRCTSRAPTATATSLYYAIADLAAFVTPGDPVDVEAHRRGQTLYGADAKVPLHPTSISEDAALAAARPGPPGPALDDHRRRRRASAPTSRSSGRGCGRTAQLDYAGRAASASTTAPPTSP